MLFWWRPIKEDLGRIFLDNLVIPYTRRHSILTSTFNTTARTERQGVVMPSTIWSHLPIKDVKGAFVWLIACSHHKPYIRDSRIDNNNKWLSSNVWLIYCFFSILLLRKSLSVLFMLRSKWDDKSQRQWQKEQYYGKSRDTIYFGDNLKRLCRGGHPMKTFIRPTPRS